LIHFGAVARVGGVAANSKFIPKTPTARQAKLWRPRRKWVLGGLAAIVVVVVIYVVYGRAAGDPAKDTEIGSDTPATVAAGSGSGDSAEKNRPILRQRQHRKGGAARSGGNRARVSTIRFIIAAIASRESSSSVPTSSDALPAATATHGRDPCRARTAGTPKHSTIWPTSNSRSSRVDFRRETGRRRRAPKHWPRRT
jgi:hypothetical protein